MGDGSGKRFDATLIVSIALVEHVAIFKVLGMADMSERPANDQAMGPGATLLCVVVFLNAGAASVLYAVASQRLADVRERIYWVALALAFWPWCAACLLLLLGFPLGPYVLPVGIVTAHTMVALMLHRGRSEQHNTSRLVLLSTLAAICSQRGGWQSSGKPMDRRGNAA